MQNTLALLEILVPCLLIQFSGSPKLHLLTCTADWSRHHHC